MDKKEGSGQKRRGSGQKVHFGGQKAKFAGQKKIHHAFRGRWDSIIGTVPCSLLACCHVTAVFLQPSAHRCSGRRRCNTWAMETDSSSLLACFDFTQFTAAFLLSFWTFWSLCQTTIHDSQHCQSFAEIKLLKLKII